MELKVRIKKLHPDAVIPRYAKPADAGLDLTAVSRTFDNDGNVVYGTGLAFEIPDGYYGQIQPRSSLTKLDLQMLNTPAVIDAGYRGEVLIKFRPALMFDRGQFPTALNPRIYDIGERIAQMIILPYPRIAFEEADELSQTDRGDGGYGSSGR